MTRLLCCADLHLEAGGDYGTQPGERLREQEDVWARALELGREAEADAILFGGDAFHKAKPSPEAMLAFERPILAHRDEGGCPIIAIPGNHDYSSATGGLGLEVFAEAGLLTLARTPHVLTLAGGEIAPAFTPGGIAIACLPWAPAARLIAAAGGGDRDELNQAAADTLLSVARGLRAQSDGPCVLLTHFSVSGAVTPDGADVGLFREPVLDAGELEAIGFEAIVAGHIHKPQVLGHGPTIQAESARFYTGSPMPLSFGEAKSDHGVWILDVDEAAAAAFVPIESRRFVTIEFDYTDEGQARWLDAASEHPSMIDPEIVRDAVVKLRIRATSEGARRLDVGAIKRSLVTAGAHKVWAVQTDVIREDRARVQGLDETLDELQALDLYLTARGINGTRGARLRELTTTYLEETRA